MELLNKARGRKREYLQRKSIYSHITYIFCLIFLIQLQGCYRSNKIDNFNGDDANETEDFIDSIDNLDLNDGGDAAQDTEDVSLDSNDTTNDSSAEGEEDANPPDDPYVLVWEEGGPISQPVYEKCEEDWIGTICEEYGMICCENKCIDPNISTYHCGGCGRICPYPMHCENGRCVGAPEGMLWCGCAWGDPDSVFHCGSCGNLCPYGATCESGECSWTDIEGCPVNPDTGERAEPCGSACYSFGIMRCFPAHCCSCDIAIKSVPEEVDNPYFPYGSCSSTVPAPNKGECAKPYGRTSNDNLGRPYLQTPICEEEYIESVIWLRGERLPSCPEGFVILDLQNNDTSGCRCIPLKWDDSGNVSTVNWYVPCGTEESWVKCGGSGSACRDGECTCIPPYVKCVKSSGSSDPDEVKCTDTSKDPYNCGECGNSCGTPCVDGRCTD